MFSVNRAIANQYACKSIIEADEQFAKSCEMCCNSPQCLYRNCDTCKVAMLHDYIVDELKKSIDVSKPCEAQ